MPGGVPVATVAIGGAANAAVLAAEIIAVGDPEMRAKLRAYREELAGKVARSDESLRRRLGK
jgi:5-(carboxyamino)imidazole ribonucleotide mutase